MLNVKVDLPLVNVRYRFACKKRPQMFGAVAGDDHIPHAAPFIIREKVI
jgi:hypothetical protein